jgi:putative oxidoreductase
MHASLPVSAEHDGAPAAVLRRGGLGTFLGHFSPLSSRAMSIYTPAAEPWLSRMLAVLRIVCGLTFLTSGTTKLFGYPPPPAGVVMPPLVILSQMGIGGILELVGGLCILLGLFTRPMAFILSGEMAVAYFQFHFPTAFWPTTNNGLPAVLFCFVFLYLAAAGGGAWSFDRLIVRRRSGDT